MKSFRLPFAFLTKDDIQVIQEPNQKNKPDVKILFRCISGVTNIKFLEGIVK